MLRFGRVAAIHPEDNSVDLVMTDDGSRLVGVQVLGLASTNTGLADLPMPTAQPSDKWALTQTTGRDLIAACLPGPGARLWVIDFVFPQVCQMLFKEVGRMVYRHQSDLYATVTDAGEFELFHPSGTFLRIGESAAHEDLTGKDADGKWKIARNTTRAPHVSLQVANSGGLKASIDIDPSGNVTATNAGTFSWHSTGNMSFTSDGTMTLSSAGAMSVKSTGSTLALQALTSMSFTAASLGSLLGGGTGTATMQGAFAFSGTLTSNAKDVSSTHTHGGVTVGSGSTAVPN